MLNLTHCKAHGFEAILLKNSELAITVIPQLGAKVTSIVSLKHNREWLADDKKITLKITKNNDFSEHDNGGWDECFPGISPQVYEHIPDKTYFSHDHGELWCQAWQITNTHISDEEIVLNLQAEVFDSTFTFIRTFTLKKHSKRLLVDYQIKNNTTDNLPFVWSAHPIFAVEPQMRILINSKHIDFKVDEGLSRFYNVNSAFIKWSEYSTKVPPLNEVMPYSSGFASKIFSKHLNTGSHKDQNIIVKLVDDKAQQSCGFEFSSASISHLGLWFNYNGWSATGASAPFVLGIEPCIGNSDSLQHSIQNSEHGIVEKGQTKFWRLVFFVN